MLMLPFQERGDEAYNHCVLSKETAGKTHMYKY